MLSRFVNIFSEDNRSISPVVGAILLVAVTVILATVVGALVFGFTPGDSQGSPAAVTVSEKTGDGEYSVQVVQMNNADEVKVSAGGESITLTSVGESASVSLAEDDSLKVKSVGSGGSGQLVSTKHQTSSGAGSTSLSKSGGEEDYSKTVSSFDSGSHNNTQEGSVKLGDASGLPVINEYSVENGKTVAKSSDYFYVKSGTSLSKVDIQTGQKEYSKDVFPSSVDIEESELSGGYLYVRTDDSDRFLKIDSSTGDLVYDKSFSQDTFAVDESGNLYLFKSASTGTSISVTVKDASDYSDKWTASTDSASDTIYRSEYNSGSVYLSGSEGVTRVNIDSAGQSVNHDWDLNEGFSPEFDGFTDGNLITYSSDTLRLVDTDTGTIEHKVEIKSDSGQIMEVEDVVATENEIRVLSTKTTELGPVGPTYSTYDKTLSKIDSASRGGSVDYPDSVYVTGDGEFTIFTNEKAKTYDANYEGDYYVKSGTYKSKLHTLDTPADISTLEVDIGNVPQGGEVKIELISALPVPDARYNKRVVLSEKTITSEGTVEVPVRTTETNNLRFRITLERGDTLSETPVVESVKVSGPLNKDSDISSVPRSLPFKLSKNAYDLQVQLIQDDDGLSSQEKLERICNAAGDLSKDGVNDMTQSEYDALVSACPSADIPSRTGGGGGGTK